MRRGKVIVGEFKQGGRRSSLERNRSFKPMLSRRAFGWWRYGLVGAGAVAAGLLIGAGPSLLPRAVSALSDQNRHGQWQTEVAATDDGSSSARLALGGSSRKNGAEAAARRVSFSLCHVGGGRNCVVDGDTIWMDGVKIRLADIDAPETHDFRCLAEKERGDQATRRLLALLNSGVIGLTSIDREADRYGRRLRIVTVDGVSAGERLVEEGLARPFGAGRRPWC